MNQRTRRLVIPTINRPKNVVYKNGLSELYKLYISNNYGINSNNIGLYLPNHYIRRNSNNKRSNSNSYINPNIVKGKKKLSPLNI